MSLRRISKPGRRLYSTSRDLRRVAGGTGTLVVSTSRGIMSGQEAKIKKLGGELICEAR
jgi:small subunit ribosomal protein S8